MLLRHIIPLIMILTTFVYGLCNMNRNGTVSGYWHYSQVEKLYSLITEFVCTECNRK